MSQASRPLVLVGSGKSMVSKSASVAGQPIERTIAKHTSNKHCSRSEAWRAARGGAASRALGRVTLSTVCRMSADKPDGTASAHPQDECLVKMGRLTDLAGRPAHIFAGKTSWHSSVATK